MHTVQKSRILTGVILHEADLNSRRILVFVFAIGPDKTIYSQVGIGIIWTLILLSTNLSIKKLYQDDFKDGNLILFYISGISLELVVIVKIIAAWLFFQLPFLIYFLS